MRKGWGKGKEKKVTYRGQGPKSEEPRVNHQGVENPHGTLEKKNEQKRIEKKEQERSIENLPHRQSRAPCRKITVH